MVLLCILNMHMIIKMDTQMFHSPKSLSGVPMNTAREKTFGNILIGSLLVERKANIRNQYNKYHIRPGTIWKSDQNTRKHNTQ